MAERTPINPKREARLLLARAELERRLASGTLAGAEELRDTGLSAVSVLPGSVDTDMLKQTPFSADMRAEDVAAVVVYCALDAPLAMNGASVEVFGAGRISARA